MLGVYSLSDAPPLKMANFDIRFLNMENREKISDWKFLVAGGDGGLGSATNSQPNSMIGRAPPPSLFPSATPAVDSGGKSGAAPSAGAAGGKGSEPPPPAPRQEPDAPAPDEMPPPEPPPEEEVEEDAEEEAKPVEPVEPSVIVAPPPLPRARRY